MKISFSIAVPCALLLSFAAGAAQAQLLANDQRETWMDGSRTQVWKNGYGECWHSAFGPSPPPDQCGPAPVAEYVPPPAPKSVAAPPPPLPPVGATPTAPVEKAIEYVPPPKKDRN